MGSTSIMDRLQAIQQRSMERKLQGKKEAQEKLRELAIGVASGQDLTDSQYEELEYAGSILGISNEVYEVFMRLSETVSDALTAEREFESLWKGVAKYEEELTQIAPKIDQLREKLKEMEERQSELQELHRKAHAAKFNFSQILEENEWLTTPERTERLSVKGDTVELVARQSWASTDRDYSIGVVFKKRRAEAEGYIRRDLAYFRSK